MGDDKPAAPSADSEVTVEQWLAMSDAQRAQLPKARQKKLAKYAEVQRKKEAKAQAGGGAQAAPAGESNRAKKKAEKSKKAAKNAQTEFVDTTPKGAYKHMNTPMLASYHPKAVEAAWYDWWEASGFFSADASRGGKDESGQFVMVIPPPNVTGTLHLGHTLTNAIQDCLTRWHRMCGKTVVWLPGLDHAGIATQTVVEKRLWKDEQKTRHDLGREKFLERVWQWKNEYGDRIRHQIRRQAASVDWAREEFTMSPKLSVAVKEAFVRMYDQGLIYRDTRLVNWCCKLNTALSEIEVNYITLPGRTLRKVPSHDDPVEFGVMTEFAYKLEDSDEELVIATTRLETMLGDVAVAVHPDDKRYSHVVGKKLVHPFFERRLDVITDGELVDMNVGTGAVKITPAHDPNDYSCGRRHSLREINIMDDDGRINNNGGQFAGMRRYVARVEIEKRLKELGLFRGKKDNPDMRLGVCSRSGDVIEPLLKPQWYVKCDGMAKQALAAAQNGDLKIYPTSFNETWSYWMENIRDWCVSRQLWWGHRIPAYKVISDSLDTEEWVVGRSEEEAQTRAMERFELASSSFTLQQDGDVLDTWFSSGLFPFSTFGWPDTESRDFKAFYPNTLLETGHDIIFFWVARMVMMGLTLTGKLPFSTVFLHPMVRDKHGRKMTKSLGNVIDPLELYGGVTLQELLEKLKTGNLDPDEIERASAGMTADYPEGIPECGSDAVRFGLLAYTVQERDLNLDVARVVSYRHFCNKLWNATRFVLAAIGDGFLFKEEGFDAALEGCSAIDAWIVDRLNCAAKSCNDGFSGYKFAEPVTAAYNFWLYEFCDVYLEAVKPVLKGEDEKGKSRTQHILYKCLHNGLRMIHPMMPFVSEELYQRLPNRRQHDAAVSIMVAEYPQFEARFENAEAVRCVEYATRVSRTIRSMRSSYNLKPSAKPTGHLICRGKEAYADATSVSSLVTTLSGLGELTCHDGDSRGPPGAGVAVSVVDEGTKVELELAGLVDFKAEVKKLQSSAAQKKLTIESLEQKQCMEGYEEKVPESERTKITEKLEKSKQELADFNQLIQRMQELQMSPPNPSQS